MILAPAASASCIYLTHLDDDPGSCSLSSLYLSDSPWRWSWLLQPQQPQQPVSMWLTLTMILAPATSAACIYLTHLDDDPDSCSLSSMYLSDSPWRWSWLLQPQQPVSHDAEKIAHQRRWTDERWWLSEWFVESHLRCSTDELALTRSPLPVATITISVSIACSEKSGIFCFWTQIHNYTLDFLTIFSDHYWITSVQVRHTVKNIWPKINILCN